MKLVSFGGSKKIALTHIGKLIFPTIAQLAEHSAVDGEVAGASPARGTLGLVLNESTKDLIKIEEVDEHES